METTSSAVNVIDLLASSLKKYDSSELVFSNKTNLRVLRGCNAVTCMEWQIIAMSNWMKYATNRKINN